MVLKKSKNPFLHPNHPLYEPEKWNKNISIKKSHNCYTYALNIISKKQSDICLKWMKKMNVKKCRWIKPQVGMSNSNILREKYPLIKLSCSKIIRKIQKENPYLIYLKKNKHKNVPYGYYKIALFLKNNFNDYHFYRQDKDKIWSHKNGHRRVKKTDEKNRIIYDIEKADHGIFNVFCGYFACPISLKKKKISVATYKDFLRLTNQQKKLKIIKNELNKF